MTEIHYYVVEEVDFYVVSSALGEDGYYIEDDDFEPDFFHEVETLEDVKYLLMSNARKICDRSLVPLTFFIHRI